MADPPNQFFKFIPPGFKFNLSIPKAFLAKLDGWRDKKAILRRGRHKWPVHIGNGGVFSDGWMKFVAENGVQEFDIIVFKHQGDMVFDFFVFDPSGCERQYPYLPDHVEEVILESDALHIPERSKMLKKRKRTDYSSQSKDKQCLRVDDDSCFVTIMTAYNITSSRLSVPMKFARLNGLTTKNMHTQIVLVDEAKRTCPAKLHFRADQIRLRGWRKLIIKNDLKVGDACMFKLVEDGEVPVFNIYNLGKKTNSQVQVKKESRSTMKIKKMTDSNLGNHPYFILTMKPSYRDWGLYLPVEFLKSNGLKVGEMILKDDKDRSWKIQLRIKDEKYLCTKSNGFRDFWDANGLKIGDDYKFVLVENDKGKPPIMNVSYLGKKPRINNQTQVSKETDSSTSKETDSSTSKETAGSTRYFICTLKPYSRERSSLYLPLEFSRANDLRTGKMILLDDKNRSWKVKLNKQGRNRFYLGRGFRDFWVANGLMEGDVYKFELAKNQKDEPRIANFSYLGKKPVKNHIQETTTSSIKNAIGSTLLKKEKCKPPIMKDSAPSGIEDCPYYIGEVKAYYIELSMLYLPSNFVVENGLLNKEKMILKNEDERSWSVGIKHVGNCCHIRRGLKEFYGANGLKKGDQFKLELISNGEIPVANFYVQKVH